VGAVARYPNRHQCWAGDACRQCLLAVSPSQNLCLFPPAAEQANLAELACKHPGLQASSGKSVKMKRRVWKDIDEMAQFDGFYCLNR